MSEATFPATPAGTRPEDAQVSDIARLPEATEEEAHLVVEKVWRFFCSLRLTLANLLSLFLAMIAGTFVNPSNDSLTNIEKAFGTARHTWHLLGRDWNPVLWSYRTFELYDLFHSWWFTLLLTSLALNLVACSLERLPRIWFLVRYPEKRLDKVQGLRFKAAQPRSSTSLEKVAEALRRQGYRAELLAPEEGAPPSLFAEKGRYSRFGVWVVHLSLLLILGGGVYGRLTAYEGTAEVPQGGGENDTMIVRKPDGTALRRKLTDQEGRQFLVRCDDFRLKEFEPGRPKAFESDLRLFSRRPDGSAGPLLAEQTINVNHPLKYGGLTFYQASYRQLDEQMRAKVLVTDKLTGEKKELLVAPGEPIEAAGGLRYSLVDYRQDFAGLGPAVQVVRSEGRPGTSTSFWVFNRSPAFDKDNRVDRFAFSFDKLTAIYATTLQVARDPSTPWVYLGCFLLFAGIGIAFYTSHKRVWAQLVDGRLALGAAAHRNAEAFSDEFAALCDQLGVAPPARKGQGKPGSTAQAAA